MRFAVLAHGTVVNVIIWDGDDTIYTPPGELILIDDESPVEAGWTFDDGWIEPPHQIVE